MSYLILETIKDSPDYQTHVLPNTSDYQRRVFEAVKALSYLLLQAVIYMIYEAVKDMLPGTWNCQRYVLSET